MIKIVVIKPKRGIHSNVAKVVPLYNRYNGDIVGAWPLSI